MEPVSSFNPVVYSLKLKVFFCERADGRADDGQPMNVNDRLHLDCSPYDGAGKEITTGDPRIAAFLKKEGDVGAPACDWRWTVNGKMNWNSQDEEDHFHMESYNAPGKGKDTDNGFTPVFRLERQAGSGTSVAEFWAVVAAADNGGLALESNHVKYMID